MSLKKKENGGEILVKFSKEVCETIYDLVGKGYTVEQICAVCNISIQTFYNWKNRGKKAKSGKFKQFVNELEKAKAHRKEHFLDKLIEKTDEKSDWKGYAWLLEREFSDEYARPEVKIKQTVDAKAEVEHKVPFGDLERIVIESGKKSDEEKKKVNE